MPNVDAVWERSNTPAISRGCDVRDSRSLTLITYAQPAFRASGAGEPGRYPR